MASLLVINGRKSKVKRNPSLLVVNPKGIGLGLGITLAAISGVTICGIVCTAKEPKPSA